jgi:hypothetical protein
MGVGRGVKDGEFPGNMLAEGRSCTVGGFSDKNGVFRYSRLFYAN